MDAEYILKPHAIMIPKQLPKGLSEQEIKDTAMAQGWTFQIIVIVAAILLKAGSSRLIILILALQIISYFPLYQVDFPAELEIQLIALRKIAEFDILPTELIKEYMVE